jgi:copper chaperone CopZ
MSTTSTYSVQGMTCGHCASAVSHVVSALVGVRSVDVDLVAGWVSTVRVVSEAPLADDAVAAALDEAGDYTLVSS